MKKIRILSLFLSLLMLMCAVAAPSAGALESVSYSLPEDTTISAQSALVVHLGTSAEKDTMLYSKNADASLAPAAMVRVMVGITAMTIIEEKNLDMDTATGTYTDACFQAIAGSGIATAGMVEGDVWTLRDLLTISMIQSAGDAVETLAFALAGTDTAFVQRMNELASSQVGCTGTVFTNVHGNDDPKQVTTTMDMYRMLRYAMNFAELQSMLSLTDYTVKPKKGEGIILPNVNNLLRASTDSYYAPAQFGRSGWSDLTGPGVAAVARDNGYEYMVVVMGCSQESGNDHFADARTLFRWAFGNFSLTTVRTKNDPIVNVQVRLCWEQDNVQLVPKEDVTAILPDTLDTSTLTVELSDVPSQLDAPVEKGKTYGSAAFYTSDGQKIGEVELVADQSLSRSQWLFIWHCIGSFFTSGWFWGGLFILIALAGGYVLLTIRYNRQRRQQQQRQKPQDKK